MENSTRENRMKPKLKPLLINRQIDFESVTKTAPVMAIIEPNESPIESAVHDLRVAIEQEVKKNNVHRTYSEGKQSEYQRFVTSIRKTNFAQCVLNPLGRPGRIKILLKYPTNVHFWFKMLNRLKKLNQLQMRKNNVNVSYMYLVQTCGEYDSENF